MLASGDNIKPILEYSVPNKQEYCEIHDYDFKMLPFEDDWQRFKVMLSLLSEYHTVMYMDTDTLITDLTVPLRYRYGWKGFVIAADLFGFNSGVMIARRDPMTYELLHAINELGPYLAHNHPWKEQEVLRRLLTAPPYADHPFWHCALQTELNAYPNEYYDGRANFSGGWKPGMFVLHLPGMSNETRLQIMSGVQQHIVRPKAEC
jgi:hypothetical protein